MLTSLTLGTILQSIAPFALGIMPARYKILDLAPIVPLLPMPEPPPAARPRATILLLPLSPPAAAQRFRDWMLAWGFTGTREWSGPNGLWEYYRWHCADEKLQPIPDQLLANALAKIVAKKQVRDHSSGSLRRISTYCIEAPTPPAKVSKGKKRAKPGKAPAKQRRKLAA
jgi:hypothetical protein